MQRRVPNNTTQWTIAKIASYRRHVRETREVHLPERGTASVACQPGCSPSTLPCRSPFPLQACSSAWTRGTVDTPSGFRQRTACRPPPPYESNENEGPPPTRRNYWMSSGKSTGPGGSPRNKPAIQFPVSARQRPPRFCPPCRLACLWKKVTFVPVTTRSRKQRIIADNASRKQRIMNILNVK